MRVLITGATGLIGREVTRLCQEKGMIVNYLTTSKAKIKKEHNLQGFYWNPSKGEIDVSCLEKVGVILNLAGENVFQRWTVAAKKRILKSRIDSAELLYKTLKQHEHQVGQVVAASAIGIYPSSYEKMYYEDEEVVSKSFLGRVVEQWEASNDKLVALGLRVAKIRTGLVLANDGGALPKMQMPFHYNIGTGLGNGKQWQSWIHITDLARIYIHVFENGLTGTYNAAAPNPLRHQDFMREIGKAMGKRIWLPNLPSFIVKLVMGEMSNMVLSSQLVGSKKIQSTSFSFRFTNLTKAIEDLNQRRPLVNNS